MGAIFQPTIQGRSSEAPKLSNPDPCDLPVPRHALESFWMNLY
jgi:hypothetical protein